MKVVIRPKVSKHKVPKAIPAHLSDRLPSAVLTENEYTLILFGMDNRDITSAPVRKALEKVKDLERPIIAAGPRFTLDALKLLQLNNAIVVSTRESLGTDELRERAKTLVRSKVKTPALR